MKKLKQWYSGRWFRSGDNDKQAEAHGPPVVQSRHVSRRQTCDDQLSIRAARQPRGNKARFRSLGCLGTANSGEAAREAVVLNLWCTTEVFSQ